MSDNIFVERLWRSVKRRHLFKLYQDVLETKTGLNEYFPFYNNERRHQSQLSPAGGNLLQIVNLNILKNLSQISKFTVLTNPTTNISMN